MSIATRTRRLVVSHRDPQTRRYSRVGELTKEGSEFVFIYDEVPSRELPGLPLGGSHRSTELFPIFAERVMHPRRPDRAASLAQLGLPEEAGPFEVLAISGTGGGASHATRLCPRPASR